MSVCNVCHYSCRVGTRQPPACLRHGTAAPLPPSLSLHTRLPILLLPSTSLLPGPPHTHTHTVVPLLFVVGGCCWHLHFPPFVIYWVGGFHHTFCMAAAASFLRAVGWDEDRQTGRGRAFWGRHFVHMLGGDSVEWGGEAGDCDFAVGWVGRHLGDQSLTRHASSLPSLPSIFPSSLPSPSPVAWQPVLTWLPSTYTHTFCPCLEGEAGGGRRVPTGKARTGWAGSRVVGQDNSHSLPAPPLLSSLSPPLYTLPPSLLSLYSASTTLLSYPLFLSHPPFSLCLSASLSSLPTLFSPPSLYMWWWVLFGWTLHTRSLLCLGFYWQTGNRHGLGWVCAGMAIILLTSPRLSPISISILMKRKKRKEELTYCGFWHLKPPINISSIIIIMPFIIPYISFHSPFLFLTDRCREMQGVGWNCLLGGSLLSPLSSLLYYLSPLLFALSPHLILKNNSNNE